MSRISEIAREMKTWWSDEGSDIEVQDALDEIIRLDADRKTENSSEKPNNCEAQTCDNCKLKGTTKWCDNQVVCRAYKPKDEPQTETSTNSEKVQLKVQLTDEPQTDCAWR